MKRWPLLIAIYALVGLLAAALSYQSNHFIHNKLKKIVLTELGRNLSYPIKIGQLDGNLLAGVSLRDVIIYDNKPVSHFDEILRAESIEVNYNLLNFIPGLCKTKKRIDILVINPTINIEHYADDTFNVVKMLRPSTPSQNGDFPWKLQLSVRQAQISYFDHRGFGSVALKEPVLNRGSQVNLTADFDGNVFNFESRGSVCDALGQRPFKFKGKGNLAQNQFGLTLTAANLDVPKWARYIIPLEGISFSQGQGSVALGISSRKSPPRKNEMPFDLKVWINAHDVALRLPWIRPEIRQASGRLIVANDYVRFEEVRAQSGGAPFILNGMLSHFAKLRTDLSIYIPQLNLAQAEEFYPFFSKWKLQGDSALSIAVKSADSIVPVVSGRVAIPSANVYGYQLSQALGTFEYKEQQLSFALDKGNFYGGGVKFAGLVNLAKPLPFITLQGQAMKVDVHQLFRESSLFSGFTDGSYAVQGVPNDLEIKAHLTPVDVLFYKQPLQQTSILARYRQDVLDFQEVSINVLQGNPVRAKGRLFADKTFDVSVHLDRLPVDNSRFDPGVLGRVSGLLSGQAEASGKWTEQFTREPLQFARGSGNFAFENLSVHDQSFSGLSGSLRIDAGKIYLPSVVLWGEGGLINADLILDRLGLTSARVSATDFRLEKYSLITANLPEPYSQLKTQANYNFKLERKPIPKRPSGTFLEFISAYNITGSVLADAINFNDQPIQRLQMNFNWDGWLFNMDNIQVREGYSVLAGAGYVSRDKKFRINFRSPHILLDDFLPLTRKFGNIGGNGTLSGTLYGTAPSWNLDSHFDLATLRYNSVLLDKVQGNIQKTGEAFNVSPLIITYKKNIYNLAGKFILSKPIKYNLTFDVADGNMANLIKLITMVKTETSKKMSGITADVADTHTLDLEELFKLGSPPLTGNVELLYSKVGSQNAMARYYAVEESANKSFKEEQGLQDTFGGSLTGTLSLNNMDGGLSINSDFQLKDGHISSLTFETLTAKIETSKGQIVLRTELKKGQIVDGEFDEIMAEMVLDDKNILSIRQMEMAALGQPSGPIMSGTLPLGGFMGQDEREKVNLDIILKKNNINLLALFNRNIKWIKNEGDVWLHIGGTTDRPLLSAKHISLINAEVKLIDDLYIKSALKIPRADLTLEDNVFYADDLRIYWEGTDTAKSRNDLLLNGKITLKDFTLVKYDSVILDFDLNLQKTRMKIYFPELYMGDLLVSNANFVGPLTIALSKKAKEDYENRVVQENEVGPVLKADITALNGEIPLPDNARPKRKPSILFNVNVLIGKDVHISGGDFANGAISRLVNNISFGIVENKKPLLVRGSLNTIVIDGNLNFDSGEVVFLNKGFELMASDAQAQFLDKDKRKTNSVDFVMVFDEEQNRRRIRPLFHMVASNTFDQTTLNVLDADKKTVDKYNLLFVLDGYIFDPLSMSLYLYNTNASQPKLLTGYPYVIGRLTYDQLQDLYKYMFPELLKPEFYSQIFSSGLQGSQAQQILRGISEKQINTAFAQQLRPIERDLADKIGLYDLKFDYNLGQTVNDAVLGKTQTEQSQIDSKVLGVDFAFKVFVDRLFVKIKTQLDQNQNSRDMRLGLSEYELTVAILEWLSLNYTNRLNNNDLTNSSRGGFSLDALYNF